MIISPGRRFIFVHIPKTGGTSMALALEARAMKDDIMMGDTPKAKNRRRRLKNVKTRGRLWKHSTLSDIDGLVPNALIQESYVFTLVRNPWDRLVSYYHWLLKQSFEHPAVTLARRTSFKEFVCHDQTRRALLSTPVRHYLTMSNGAEADAKCVRLENLSEDLSAVEAHLGFALALPTVNSSDRSRDWRGYYDDECAQVVSESCREDIQRLGYTFHPP